jgi:curli production assembly/transport component CsgG/holdfast attachment protein HfaB
MKPLALVLAAVSLSGCITPGADSVGRYTAPIGGSPVISNETPYSAALRCMAGYTSHKPIRIAVGQIADYTGKAESDNSGRKLTQGAALMAMSALSKAGVQLVERFDTSVAEMELKYANNKLIGAEGVNANGDYRKIIAGSIPGSDYYLVGGITELNFNIRSEGASGDGGGTATNSLKGTIGGNLYVMNVGLDLRLVDTNTLQVVDVISYQKQIIGHQISAGVFDFLGANFFDASIGESALEPIQLAVRSVVERATLEMMVRLYHTGGTCSAVTDPLADSTDHLTPAVDHPATAVAAPTVAAATPAPDAAPAVAVATPAPEQPATNTAPEATITARNEDHPNADASRDHPYHFYNASDPNAPSLRGSE